MGKNKHNGTEYQQISMAKQGLKTFDIKLTDWNRFQQKLKYKNINEMSSKFEAS